VDLLICNTVAEGHRVPSQLRTCDFCGTEVYVSREMTPVADSGEASPICGRCWVVYESPDEAIYALHPRQMHALAESDVLEFAHEFVTHMNTLRQDRRGA
jgi:hypothetical protein